MSMGKRTKSEAQKVGQRSPKGRV